MKNSNLIVAIAFCFLFLPWSYGQERHDRQERQARLESAKIAFFTDKLKLKPEEAEKFWPLYREFQQKKADLRQQEIDRPEDYASLSKAEAKALLHTMLAKKNEALALEKTYYEKMAAVTSYQQVLALEAAESEFRRTLLRNMRKRR